MLRPGQDPASLEARLAFHLHRLKLTGKKLRDSSPSFDHSDLVQARSTLTSGDIIQLAAALHIDPIELSRALTADEENEWAFYRHSAFNGNEVWRRAASLWRSRGYSDAQAAAFMGLDRTTVANNLRTGHRTGNKVLTYARVEKLMSAIGAPGGPEKLVEDLTISYSRLRLNGRSTAG